MASHPAQSPLRTASTEHQKRILNWQRSIEDLKDSFPKFDQIKREKLQLQYKEAYQRIISYYEKGQKLPTGPEYVFTFIGVQSVWLGTMVEMRNLQRIHKALPVIDALAVQAVHDASSSLNLSQGHEGKELGVPLVQMAQNAAFQAAESGNLHPIGAQFRLPSDMGGDDERLPWSQDIKEDSGSNIQTISQAIWDHVNINGYPCPWTTVQLADGSQVESSSPTLEMRIMNKVLAKEDEWSPLTGWFAEKCVIRDGSMLLSGSGMRNQLFIANAPGSPDLYVAKTRNALMNILPT